VDVASEGEVRVCLVMSQTVWKGSKGGKHECVEVALVIGYRRGLLGNGRFLCLRGILGWMVLVNLYGFECFLLCGRCAELTSILIVCSF